MSHRPPDDPRRALEARRGRRRAEALHLRVLILGVAVLLTSGAVLYVTGLEWPTAPDPHLWWPALLVITFAVERYPIRVHFWGEAHAYIPSEVLLVIGLFLLHPFELVLSRVGGGALNLIVGERQRPIKFLVNTGVFALEVALAIGMFAALGDGIRPTDGNLLVALAAVTIGASAGVVVVWAAIGLSNHAFQPAALADTLATMVPAAGVNAALGLAAVVVLSLRPGAVWVLALPVALVAIGFRRFVIEREHRHVLTMLYDLSRQTQASPDAEAALVALTTVVRQQARARVAELYVVEERVPTTRILSSEDQEHPPGVTRIGDVPADVDQAVEHGEVMRTLARGGRCISLTVGWEVSHGRHAVFRLRDPLGDVEGFDARTEAVLTAALTHVWSVLEDADLHLAKRGFLNAVSHELRTPLTVILGVAKTLNQRGDQLPQGVRADLTHRLEGQALRLEQLLTDLLDLDRLNRGQMTPTTHPVELLSMVSELLDSIEVTTHSIEVDGDPITAALDRTMGERVVANLVSNAVKYTPAGSAIRITIEREGDHAVLAVTDQGRGIADADKERIFEPFLRLDHDHPSPGTGVGLGLVRSFAEVHGGSAWVEDAVGGGARFVVRLPAPERVGPALRLVSGDDR